MKIDGKVFWLPKPGMPRVRRRSVTIIDLQTNAANEVIAAKVKLRTHCCWVAVSELNVPKTGAEKGRRRKKRKI